MTGVGGAPTAQVSQYRAARHLRNGGLHKALNLGPDVDFTPEHLDLGSKSTNGHVAAMTDLVNRHRASMKEAPEGEAE